MCQVTETAAPEQVELEVGFIGQSIPRKEDQRLVQGEGVFVDDVKRHGMGYLEASGILPPDLDEEPDPVW